MTLSMACIFCACDDMLEDKIYDRLTPNNYFSNDAEAIAAVNGVYGALNGSGWNYYGGGNERIQATDLTTDVMAGTGGSGYTYDLSNLIWKPTDAFHRDLWQNIYKGVTLSNYLIQYLPQAAAVSDQTKKRSIAEAKTGLALFYRDLVDLFGNVPLIKTFSEGDSYPTQSPANEVLDFAIQNLNEAIPDLPEDYDGANNGRFTKGAAYALLTKIYLMKKDWAKVIESADAVLALGYTLSTNYADLFKANNQNNPEFILTKQCFPDFNVGNSMPTYSLPPDYKLPAGVNIQIWNVYRVPRNFYETFDVDDVRRSLILESYANVSGGTTVLGASADLISVKYEIDPGANIVFGSNDVPIIRLADVILAKAEALNEMNGPSQAAVDLINQVRDRAFNNDASKRIAVADFGSKDELRDWILMERSWELWFEGHRRTDLLRHGKFLEKATERGAVDVSPGRLVFPVPQQELDVNKNLVPNG